MNADDFGLTASVNAGVERGFLDGVVTSASLMTARPAAAAAADFARRHPALSVGLHLDLGEWVCRDGRWQLSYEVVDPGDPLAVQAEVERQLAAFRDLLGRDPTHVDSHQHVHLGEPARGIVRTLAESIDVPVRRLDRRVRFCGDFYGQSGTGTPLPSLITVESLLTLVDGLPAGCNELGCHPAAGSVPESVYDRERSVELATLTDPRVVEALREGPTRLASFHELGDPERVAPILTGAP
ncbi:MAG: ChbG/HpnK family deacetylase [Gemmatimonadota bacterium]|nr:ChbG/HpnK family deacetylase [Gemmatimonadota bacterium]